MAPHAAEIPLLRLKRLNARKDAPKSVHAEICETIMAFIIHALDFSIFFIYNLLYQAIQYIRLSFQ